MAAAAAAARARLTSRPVPEALGVATFVTVASFPVRATQPRAGLDSSWQLGLSLAHTHDLRFGPELVFTYGPLGFLAAPQDAFLPGAVLGVAYAAVTCLALFALLFVAARRWLPAWAAALLVLAFSAVTPFTSTPELGALALALAGLRLLEPDRLQRPLPLPAAVVLGLAAALQLLVKSSTGGFFLAVAVLIAAVRPQRATRVATVLASFALGLVALWMLSGQHLGDLAGWARSAAAVASGYAGAMALYGMQDAWTPILVLLGLLVWRASALANEDLRHRWPQLLLLAMTTWFFVKAGYVRLDQGHVLITLVGLSGLLVWFRWSGGLRVVGAGAALVGVLWFVGVQSLGPPSRWDSVVEVAQGHRDGLTGIVGVAQQVVDADEHRRRLDEAQRETSASYRVSPEVLAALDGGSVHADPSDIAAVWSNHLEWRPLPVFQAYSVYEQRLDDLNADVVAGDDAPDGILRTTAGIDGRFQPWEPPRTRLEVTCRYRVAAEDERWQALVRSGERCGASVELGEVEAAAGEVVEVPEASNDAHLVVASFSDPRGPLDALAEATFKPFGTHVVDVDGEPHRWLPGTAGQPHLLRVPTTFGGAALPDGGLDVGELRFAEPVHITFSEVPIEGGAP